MKLSSTDIAQLQSLYRQRLGKELSKKLILERAICLINFVKTLESPVDNDRDVAFMEEFAPPLPRRTQLTAVQNQSTKGDN